MRLVNLFEEDNNRKELIIFGGGFQPFLPSHLYCWNYLKDKFPEADHFIASSNNTKVRPFSFKEKHFLASQSGIPKDKFIEVNKPYSPIEICKNYDPNKTILIFGVSEKDGERFGASLKKNGELKYLLPYPSASTYLESMDKHAYYVIIPEVQTFTVLGKEISSATQIRELYKTSNESDRMSIIRELYPNSTKINIIKRIFDRALLSDKINESIKSKNIDCAGWITPEDKFIPNKICGNAHLLTLRNFNIPTYDIAYMLGWIRCSVAEEYNYDFGEFVFQFETIVPFKRVEKRLNKFAKMVNGICTKIVAFGGTGETFKRYDWDGKQFYNINGLYESKIGPCWPCKGEGYIKTGHNKGYFCKYCKGSGKIVLPDVDFKMRQANDLTESPDFNYSRYNDKEEELKNCTFKVRQSYTGYYIHAYSKDHDYIGYIQCYISQINDAAYVKQSQIDDDYKGTGLGQMLYDIAIQYAKKISMSYFNSDTSLSSDAHKAWNRLGSRYKVKKIEPEFGDDPYYQIELYDVNPPKREIIEESIDINKVELIKLRPVIVKRVQEVYDSWDGGETGLCNEMAYAICDTIFYNSKNINTQVVGHKNPKLFSRHYWVKVGFPNDTYYDVDLPFGKYETYNRDSQCFIKIPNVIFKPTDLLIYQSRVNFNKAPWELRKSYTPNKSDEYFTLDDSKLLESPDFGYKPFNNRDEEISKLIWKVKEDKHRKWNNDEEKVTIIIKVYDPKSDKCIGYIDADADDDESKNSLRIDRSQIAQNSNWESTGLGQMLYDRLIQEAKKRGFRYLNSDFALSIPARKAWAKLSNRYDVKKLKHEGENYFSIDLDTVKLNESKISEDIKSEDESIVGIKKYLETIKGFRGNLPKDIKYSTESFILEFGKHYYMNENSFVGKRGIKKQCYMNAYKLMMKNPQYTYVEGYVDIGPLHIEHAWCINKEGIVIDPTFVQPEESHTIKPHGYFGVPFLSKYVMDVALETGVYGIISFTNRNLFLGKIEPKDFLAK